MPWPLIQLELHVDDKALSLYLGLYLHHKATAWYLWFPPVHSPDCTNDTQKVLETDLEGPAWASASDVEDVVASRPILTEAEDTSDDGA